MAASSIHPPDRNAAARALSRSLRPWLRFGVAIVLGVFVALGAWSATAEIAQAVIAEGAVRVDTNRKRIQHLEGGTIREILVRDGDRVVAGQALVRLDETRARASLEIVRANHDAELARLARLTSEREEAERITFPEVLLDRADEPDVARLVKVQTELFESRRTGLRGQIELLGRQIAQLEEKRVGIQSQIRSLTAQAALVEDERASVASLLEQGFVEKPRLLALQKEAARLEGERGRAVSEYAETRTEISQKEQEILQLRNQFREAVVDELRDSQSRLRDLRERFEAARYVVDNLEVRAPVDGIVVSLSVFSSGEVLRPGDVVLELVPIDESLAIEARVALRDVDNVRIGQRADIRFTAFDTRDTPVVEGVIDYISADALEDERTGQGFFKVKVEVPLSELALLGDRQLQPGMPADVVIKTGERTVLQYLAQPLSNALAKAWTEN
jgi:HlyD family type I secretion membrane fusion protein